MRLTGTAKNITDGSLSAGLFLLAGPAMVSMLAIMLYEFIDLFWIGKLGAEAVAALGASAFVLWTIKALANCVAAGLNALIARNAGAENFSRAQMWASQGLVLTVLFALFIAFFTFIAHLRLFELLGLAPPVAQNARQFTLILTLSLVFIYGSITLDTIFRAMGNTFIPMIIMVTGLVLNAALDPLFIFGWWGFPKMGMPGAAVASALAHIGSTLMFVMALPLIHIKLKFQLHHFISHARQVLQIGMPIGLLGAIFSVIYIALSRNIAHFGTVPLAAISIGHRIEGIPFFIAFGFSTAVATVVGQNLGAGKPDRAARGALLSLAYAVAFLAMISLGFILYGKEMMRLFISDPAVIDEGYRYLFAVAVFEIFLASEVILEGAFTGAGDTHPPFLISIPLTALRIPMAYYFSIGLGYGVGSIWWTISITTMLKGVIFFLWFQRGHWKHRQIG